MIALKEEIYYETEIFVSKRIPVSLSPEAYEMYENFVFNLMPAYNPGAVIRDMIRKMR